ncbi:FecCD family ABC transporter permease [Paenibacillus humicus]|uniref:FecCD family ABC transporter permease n=1 Tax=Paenibacillus humicus TaxID=412861 RepID=UPI000FDCCBD4|nr:iron ABC transporter permease [Paenibacillus humicus]
MKFRRKLTVVLWFAAAAAGLLVTAIAAVSYGAKSITAGVAIDAVFRYDPSSTSHQIIHGLRLPRVLGAMLVGSALAAAGALMQGVTRNPLADTGILGINAGASLAVVLSFAWRPMLSYSTLMGLSFAGAAAATFIIVMLASLARKGMASLQLTVAGAVLSAMIHSLSTGMAIHYQLSQDLAFWYAGGVAGIRWEQLQWLAPVILAALVWSFTLGRGITFMSLGEEAAVNLGLRTGRIRVLAMAAVVLLAGSSVSAAGSISFVGLVVPHIARRLIGVDYRLILPFSALLGAILLTWADFASRMVQPPREFAIGAMVAMVGVPFFLYLSRKERREL